MSNLPFENASNDKTSGPSSPSEAQGKLVISSDVDRTLDDITDGVHHELLTFLCDAQAAGHRVIIVSARQIDDIETSIDLMTRLARIRLKRPIDTSGFEIISKRSLVNNKLAVDIAFDDEAVDTQYYPYATAKLEIRVGKKYVLSPYTIDELREMYSIPKSEATQTPPSPTSPAP